MELVEWYFVHIFAGYIALGALFSIALAVVAVFAPKSRDDGAYTIPFNLVRGFCELLGAACLVYFYNSGILSALWAMLLALVPVMAFAGAIVWYRLREHKGFAAKVNAFLKNAGE